jgi:hypothetical protein
MRGVVPATFAAGLVLVLAGCSVSFNQPQAAKSPEASPSAPAVSPAASTSPTPADSPTPSTAPSPKASPSPAKLIIRTLPYHMGEVGVTYGTVVLVAAGGVKPYKWTIQGGALPPGLALSKGGSTTGKPTTAGNFSFVVRLDDSAGAAAGAPSSIMVFHQLAFGPPPTYVCSGGISCALKIPYTGGIPGDKPAVKVLSVSGGNISLRMVTRGCQASVATSSPPPGTTTAASGGTMTLSLTIPSSTWCNYSGDVTYELVDHSPCGAGFLCASSNTIRVTFKY